MMGLLKPKSSGKKSNRPFFCMIFVVYLDHLTFYPAGRGLFFTKSVFGKDHVLSLPNFEEIFKSKVVQHFYRSTRLLYTLPSTKATVEGVPLLGTFSFAEARGHSRECLLCFPRP